MALIRLHNTPLEIRMDKNGRLSAYHDGKLLPGVLSINVSHERGERAVTTISFIGIATRLVTEVATISTVQSVPE